MQSQRYVYPVDISKHEKQLEEICTKLGLTKAEAIRDAIEFYYNQVRGYKVIELRNISKKQAEREILDYVKKRGRASTSEIADDLRLDVIVVDDILHELAETGKVRSK